MDIQTKPYGDNVTIIKPKKDEEWKLHEAHDEMSAIGEVVMFLWVMLISMALLATLYAIIL